MSKQCSINIDAMSCFLLFYANFQRFVSKRIVFHIEMNNSTVKKSKHQTSMSTLPVLASQFFRINYRHASRNILFHDSRSNIDIKVENNNYCNKTD